MHRFSSAWVAADADHVELLGHELGVEQSEKRGKSELQGAYEESSCSRPWAKRDRITFLARSPVAPSTTTDRTRSVLSWAMPMVFFLPLGVDTSTKDDDDADFTKDILCRLLFDNMLYIMTCFIGKLWAASAAAGIVVPQWHCALQRVVYCDVLCRGFSVLFCGLHISKTGSVLYSPHAVILSLPPPQFRPLHPCVICKVGMVMFRFHLFRKVPSVIRTVNSHTVTICDRVMTVCVSTGTTFAFWKIETGEHAFRFAVFICTSHIVLLLQLALLIFICTATAVCPAASKTIPRPHSYHHIP